MKELSGRTPIFLIKIMRFWLNSSKLLPGALAATETSSLDLVLEGRGETHVCGGSFLFVAVVAVLEEDGHRRGQLRLHAVHESPEGGNDVSV